MSDVIMKSFVFLFGLTGVLATPLPYNIAPDTAACSVEMLATNHEAPMVEYRLHVGRPFIHGAGCDPIYQTLTDGMDPGVFVNKCYTVDGGATTMLSFISTTAPSTNIQIVESLQMAYPTVPFQKDRICLMDGVDAPASWPSKKAKRQDDITEFFDDVKDKFHDLTDWIGFTNYLGTMAATPMTKPAIL